MARETVYRLRCDRCNTLHELEDPYKGIPDTWGGFTMEEYTESDGDPLWYHLCSTCFKSFENFMNGGLIASPTNEPRTFHWVQGETPLEQFGFGSMG